MSDEGQATRGDAEETLPMQSDKVHDGHGGGDDDDGDGGGGDDGGGGGGDLRRAGQCSRYFLRSYFELSMPM